MTAAIPMTKGARQQKIVDLLAHHQVRSQTELADLLARAGVNVTQATLSRDLVDLDAVKVRVASGALVYAVPAEGGDRTPRARRDPARGLREDHRAGRGPRHPDDPRNGQGAAREHG